MTEGLSGTEVVGRGENLFLDRGLASTSFFGP
jgi:hypothetical protein